MNRPMNQQSTFGSSPMSSEQYRQMLVRDGDRRFHDWHSKFLAYQQKFLAAMSRIQSR